MNAFMQWMETHFMPMAAKIGSQRHLIAIRDGFIAIMPVTMVGSIAVLLNVFLRDLPNEWLGEGNGFVAAMDPIIAINGNVYFGSITVLGIAFTISLGYHLSKSYDVNPIAGAVIAFSAVVTCMNQNAVFNYILNGVDLSSLDSLKAAGLDVIESEGAVALQNVSGWGLYGRSLYGFQRSVYLLDCRVAVDDDLCETDAEESDDQASGFCTACGQQCVCGDYPGYRCDLCVWYSDTDQRTVYRIVSERLDRRMDSEAAAWSFTGARKRRSDDVPDSVVLVLRTARG